MKKVLFIIILNSILIPSFTKSSAADAPPQTPTRESYLDELLIESHTDTSGSTLREIRELLLEQANIHVAKDTITYTHPHTGKVTKFKTTLSGFIRGFLRSTQPELANTFTLLFQIQDEISSMHEESLGEENNDDGKEEAKWEEPQ